MFGYVVMNKPEIKFKDFDLYRSFYCGLCRELRERYGISGQITLTYDLTFVILLLSGLYEPPVRKGTTRCIVHPVRRQPVRKNAITEYAADMNVFLAYYKCRDDWNDDRSPLGLLYGKVLERKEQKIERTFRQKTSRIISLLEDLSAMEKAGEKDIDKVSGCFGKIMAEIMMYQDDEWKELLEQFGFFLGKFIYLMDAYEDIEDDLKNHNYNPLKNIYTKPEFEDMIHQILMMMMAECSKAFEQLPLIDDIDILRNVLYSGVWYRYEQVREKREKEKEEKNV